MVVAGMCVLAVCLTIRSYWGAAPADAQSGEPEASSPSVAPAADPSGPAVPATASAPAGSTESKIVATVNNEDIGRDELAEECLRHYGKEVLEKLTNKYLIVLECQRRGITITQEEVSAEIEKTAGRFALPTDQWLKMLKQERGINPAQYGSDIIWPTIALRKLAKDRTQVTEEELQAEYERLYGPAVKVRLIAIQDPVKAEKIRALAAAHPEQFGDLAKNNSEDFNSASLKGMIQPIRKHTGAKVIEDTAFTLKDGEVSQVIPIAGQCVILMREELLQPLAKVPTLSEVKEKLSYSVQEQKLHAVAKEVFSELQRNAQVKNVLNDPVLSRQMPGVAALINGNPVSLRELAERCIERHGEEVLDGTIHRKILEQACRRNRITITKEDMDQEIARAASMMVKLKPDKSPDVETWLKMATTQQGITEEVYRHDAVWPSVALKKLVGDKVKVTEADLQKGFEANYGPRVRAMAILLDSQRQAMMVWGLARKNPTPEYFGKLAEQYSCDANNRAMKGEIAPIQKHGGQPDLEESAFKLAPGELSGLIQVNGTAIGHPKYVILLCLGRTQPMVNVDFATVRDDIYQDIHEKMVRVAMATTMDQLKAAAKIDNYLARVCAKRQRPR